ncbi:MAG: glucose-6-phosphate isomerase [Actinomycetota bacterium]|nr:glucose-6-phosphate isomerase [Actinomycetota bacterium]
MSSADGVRVETVGPELVALGNGARSSLVREGVAPALAGKDASLWGPEAEAEASVRLGWLDVPRSSRQLLPQLAELRERVRAAGLEHVVLAGMGGSSLAPEVITRTQGVELTVLDTTDPHQVRRALADRLDRTVLVVASKSGGTVETDSHRRAYEQAFRDAGLTPEELAGRIVVVTDPGSPLESVAREAGYAVVLADPEVGGRYSALTAFGLVPSALAGADVAELLTTAADLEPALAKDDANPGLELGAVLGGAATAGRDKIVLADAGSGIVGFGDWAEQLIAESTGKQGKGLLPVVVESTDAPGFRDAGEDAHRLVLGAPPESPDRFEGTVVSGPLGAQFLLWEYATAVAGRVLGINPFDQPNVQESKDSTQAVLEEAGDGSLPEGAPAFTDGAVAVYADPGTLRGAGDLAGALAALLDSVDPRGYLAVLAYLDRIGEARAAELRPRLAAALAGRQVTFGWGPRFLHSTGQYHKGGPPNGAFLQLTGVVVDDLDVSGRPYTFGRLQLAQALGDLRALGKRTRPILRLHLLDRQEGLRQLLDAAGAAPR